jgi:hypothetical protein
LLKGWTQASVKTRCPRGDGAEARCARRGSADVSRVNEASSRPCESFEVTVLSRLKPTIIAAVFCAGAACSDKAGQRAVAVADYAASPVPTASLAADEPMMSPASVARRSAVSGRQAPAPSVRSALAAQMVIRSAELRVRVGDVERAVRTADSLATTYDALVADSRVNQGARGTRDARLTIRVPSPRFAEALAALHGLGESQGETVTAQDITKEYADLQTRLAVKEEMSARLRALLSNRIAKLSDVLEVERELSRVVTELEQLKGERQYYDQRVAVSSIVVYMFEANATTRAQFTAPIVAAFQKSLEITGTSLASIIYFATFLIPWLLLASVLWWIVKRVWRVQRAPVPRQSMDV